MRYRQTRKRNVLSSEAESFIKDGRLRKGRGVENESELLRKIIDSNLEGTAVFASDKGAPGRDEESRHVLDPESEKLIQQQFRNVLTRSEALKNREKIALFHERSHFFRFVLREYGKMRDFGRRTRVITCTLVPPRVRINAAVRAAFSGDLKEAVSKLRAPLQHILNEGWRTLTKLEYNLIAEFSELCRLVRSTNFRLLQVSDSRLHSLRSLETAFLICHYLPDYPTAIKKAVGVVLDRTSKFEDDLSSLKAAVDTILKEKKGQPCLYSFIAGINMIRSRRYIPFSGLVNRGIDGVINTAYFNCKRSVQKRINRQIDSTLNRMLGLRKEKTEIARMKLFLDLNEEGEPDFERLYQFINSSNVMQGVRAESELEDMTRFTLLLFSSFVRELGKFLNGRVSVGTAAAIFAGDYFKFEVERLRYSLATLEEMQESFSALSRVRYLGLRESTMAGTPQENEFLRLTNALVSFVLSVGRKLMHVKLFASTEDVTAPLDPKVVSMGNFAIPYRDSVMAGAGVLGGKSVLEAVTYVVSLGYDIGMFYADTGVTSALRRETPVELEIASSRSTLNRMCDPLQFQKIEQIYNLD